MVHTDCDNFHDDNGDGINDADKRKYEHRFKFVDKNEDKINDVFVDKDGDGVNDLETKFVDEDKDGINDNVLNDRFIDRNGDGIRDGRKIGHQRGPRGGMGMRRRRRGRR